MKENQNIKNKEIEICPHCFLLGLISVLEESYINEDEKMVYKCPECKSSLIIPEKEER